MLRRDLAGSMKGWQRRNMIVFTFTASFRPGRTRFLVEFAPSLPLLEELPLRSRTANGLTGGMRGDTRVLSITATEAWRIRLGFLTREIPEGLSTGEEFASAALVDRALVADGGLVGGRRGAGDGVVSCE